MKPDLHPDFTLLDRLILAHGTEPVSASFYLGESAEALEGYYQRRRAGQNRWVAELKETIDKVSATTEFKENGMDKPIALTQVPFFDVELVGIPALYYLGSQCFIDNPSFSHLMEKGKFYRIVVLVLKIHAAYCS